MADLAALTDTNDDGLWNYVVEIQRKEPQVDEWIMAGYHPLPPLSVSIQPLPGSMNGNAESMNGGQMSADKRWRTQTLYRIWILDWSKITVVN